MSGVGGNNSAREPGKATGSRTRRSPGEPTAREQDATRQIRPDRIDGEHDRSREAVEEAATVGFFREVDRALVGWQATPAGSGWSAVIRHCSANYAVVALRRGGDYSLAGLESAALGEEPSERRGRIVERLDTAVAPANQPTNGGRA